MRKLLISVLLVAVVATVASGQTQSAPTLRIVSEDGTNNLPSELMYGNTKVKPLRLRPGTNQPITIDDSDFFVQQQYVDFLSRFPDQDGFNFWNNQIASCGTDAGCIDLKRTNASGAFFLSIEFQETGFLVHKLHRVSFGAALPRYQSFMPETRQISSGIIVNATGWEAKLEANKQNFINAWVNRSDFLAAFPANMGAQAYVDKLLQTASLSGGDVDRQGLIDGLNNSTLTRATVLRRIAESSALSNREKNPAFVLMQYFGYLRRNPDDDGTLDGYNFWLGKLNSHGGDFVRADMVKSFLISGEYKGRF